MFRWKGKQLDRVDRQKIVKNWTTYGVLLIAVGAMTFFGVCDPQSGNISGPTGVAAYVGDEKITNVEFRRAYQNAYDRYQAQYREAFDPAMLQLSRSVINQLVNERLVYSLAIDNGVQASLDEVEKTIAQAEVFKDEAGNFSEEKFDQYLRSQRYTEAALTEEIRRSLTENKFRQFVAETYQVSDKQTQWDYRLADSKVDIEFIRISPSQVELTISPTEIADYIKANDKKIAEYYEKNKADYNSEKRVSAQHVLIAYKEARNAAGAAKTRNKDEARKIAETVLASAQDGKTDFAALVTQYSDDPSAKTNSGNLGLFAHKDMVKEFSDAAFALAPGQISSVVESPFGFHIIKVNEVKPEKKTPLEEAKQDIASKLIAAEKKPKLVRETAEKVLAAVKDPNKDPALLQAYATKWESTGPVSMVAQTIPKLGNSEQVRQAAFGLTPEQPLHPAIVPAGSDYLILRLKNFEKADLAKLDATKKEGIRTSQSFSEAYSVFSSLIAQAKENYEKNGKIWINEEYENWDQNRAQNTRAGS